MNVIVPRQLAYIFPDFIYEDHSNENHSNLSFTMVIDFTLQFNRKTSTILKKMMSDFFPLLTMFSTLPRTCTIF